MDDYDLQRRRDTDFIYSLQAITDSAKEIDDLNRRFCLFGRMEEEGPGDLPAVVKYIKSERKDVRAYTFNALERLIKKSEGLKDRLNRNGDHVAEPELDEDGYPTGDWKVVSKETEFIRFCIDSGVGHIEALRGALKVLKGDPMYVMSNVEVAYSRKCGCGYMKPCEQEWHKEMNDELRMVVFGDTICFGSAKYQAMYPEKN